MRAGPMRFVATLQNPSATGDEYSTVGGYAVTATGVRVGIRNVSGKETHAAKQTGSEVGVELNTRYRSDITGASRFVVGATTYEVLYVNNVGMRNRELRLPCKVVS
ncbi:phage head closure protein [Zhongshania marina]|uniref:Head-tail adaptor protein n=1 Tax=Zhongshania marina TaxID=2304603 RepID=A0A2S4HGF4_9GAMM|nr:hypothetical protein C0068_08215 [Marortus luteolus]